MINRLPLVMGIIMVLLGLASVGATASNTPLYTVVTYVDANYSSFAGNDDTAMVYSFSFTLDVFNPSEMTVETSGHLSQVIGGCNPVLMTTNSSADAVPPLYLTTCTMTDTMLDPGSNLFNLSARIYINNTDSSTIPAGFYFIEISGAGLTSYGATIDATDPAAIEVHYDDTPDFMRSRAPVTSEEDPREERIGIEGLLLSTAVILVVVPYIRRNRQH